MTNYVKTVNFAAKDSLTPGDPLKVAKGTEVNTELDNISTSISSKEDVANKNAANGYAGLDSSALIPDARLSTNVPRLGSANIYTGVLSVATAPIKLSSVLPGFILDETDGGSNQRYWRFFASGGTLTFDVMNDATNSVGSWFTVSRTGTTVTAIDLFSTALNWNANSLFTTANDGAGSSLDSDLLDGQQGAFYQSSSNQNAGTLPDARFPATLPALSGVNLTTLNANNLASGTIPAARVGASSVTQHQAALVIASDQITTGVTTKTTSFSPAAGDAEDILICNSGSTITVTLNASTLAVGESTGFIRRGAGQVTFAAGASQTINTPNTLSINTQHGKAVATYIATNTWELSGNV